MAEPEAEDGEVSGPGHTRLRPVSMLRLGARRLAGSARSRPAVALAAVYLGIVVIAAVLAPLLAPAHPNDADYGALYQGPSLHHLLGTDDLGRDLLSRLIYGARLSLIGVAEAVAVYLVLGVTFGLAAGYLGGTLDAVVVWVSEVSFGVPQIIVVLAVLAILANDSSAAMLVLGLLGAPGLAVLTRGATRLVREEPYIAAARVSGLRSSQIITRHVMPIVTGPIIVQTSLFAGLALIFQTGLDYLGIGTQPPTASWGSMVAEASTYLTRDAWMIVPSGAVITLTIVAFGLLGDGVRDRRAGRAAAPMVAIGAGVDPGLSVAQSIDRRSADAEGAGQMVIAAAGRPDGDDAGAGSVASGAVLNVVGLSVAAGTRSGRRIPLVDGVSLSVHPGEALGVVGESGCGKTMTALAIMGLLPAGTFVTGGSVQISGREVSSEGRAATHRLRGSVIAMISQEPVASLDPSFTVGAQLCEVLRRHRSLDRPAARREAIGLLEQVELPRAASVARAYPHQLSGGMAQRVAIAAALAGEPQLLIADEPTTALDVTTQAEILELLRSLCADRGLAVVLVSHDWGVIADSCDSAVVMYAGQVVETATVVELFAEPRHPYTRGLMLSDPHHAHQPRTALFAIPGAVPPLGSWPHGCRFAPRCEFASAECGSAPVAQESLGERRRVRCIHHESVAGLTTTAGARRGE